MSVTPCTRCTQTHSNPTAFLLSCASCARTWHHRCHVPPVEDVELVHRIKAHLAGDVANSYLAWKCRRCSKKKELPKVRNLDVAEPKAEVEPSPTHPRSPSTTLSIVQSKDQSISTSTRASEAPKISSVEPSAVSPPTVVPEPSIDAPMVLDSPTPPDSSLVPVEQTAAAPLQERPAGLQPVPHYDLIPHWLALTHPPGTDDIWERASQRRQSGNTRAHNRKTTAKKLGTFQPISSNNLFIFNTDDWERRVPN
ncbi:hypothetical protein BDN72DRAFT_833102 [Pluteus cervinus]|uniref:Uncharacterized protein n=1 Tax=Pluteus cervinus TaxID=181527 RepID=A0ACD3B9C6_9AGAR|nr:hypothetical protein BDN72DRAFT_833102 [Pluteus cervinus]